jgi:hypothetical protein
VFQRRATEDNVWLVRREQRETKRDREEKGEGARREQLTEERSARVGKEMREKREREGEMRERERREKKR